MTSPPNALLPTEDGITYPMIEAGVEQLYLNRGDDISFVKAIYTAMRALAKPDEGVVEHVTHMLLRWENTSPRPSATKLAEQIIAALSDNEDKPSDA